MNIFEERYFNFNRKLFVCMGLWPYGSRTPILQKYFLLFMLFVYIFPQIFSMKVHFSDVDRVMLNLVLFFIGSLMFLKVLSMMVAENKMKALYRNIADNWLAITDEKEKRILIQYSELGRKKAIYYFAFIQFSGICVFTLPSIPKILDVISPLPNARPYIHILESELFIDREMYYWLYYCWDVITIITNTSVSVSIDTMYIVCVEHCCALYAILKYRLRNLRSKMFDNFTKTEVNSYDYVISIVRLHQNTFNFTKTINEAFSILFFYILMANLACIPLNAITILSNLDKPFNCVRFSMLLIAFGVHLFMLFWPGQNVLDHGIELIDDAYCNEWYTTPIRAKKMIVIFLIRCMKPASLSAGGLMLMNFETFAKIVRTALSYIAVVASFRH